MDSLEPPVLLRPEILLIGPIRAGKTTIGRLLSAASGLPGYSLDELCWTYYRELEARSGRPLPHGPDGMFARSVTLHAVERVLAEQNRCVIDFGAGHTYYPEAANLERAEQLFAPYPHVFLLLPSPDLDQSYRVLHERNRENPWLNEFIAEHGWDPNERFLRDPSNFRLAKQVVYTEGRTPEEMCEEILARWRERGDER